MFNFPNFLHMDPSFVYKPWKEVSNAARARRREGRAAR